MFIWRLGRFINGEDRWRMARYQDLSRVCWLDFLWFPWSESYARPCVRCFDFRGPLVGVLLHISCTLTGFMWSHWCECYTIPLRCHISQNKYLLTSSLSFFIPHVVSLISTHPGFFFYSKGGSSRKKNKTKKPTNHCSYKKKHRGVAKWKVNFGRWGVLILLSCY